MHNKTFNNNAWFYLKYMKEISKYLSEYDSITRNSNLIIHFAPHIKQYTYISITLQIFV